MLVSEIMLQQTPVNRVLPVYDLWMTRWPTPAALASEVPGNAVRMWGRLGYPRRALRLHAAAVAIDRRHCGQVPSALAELRLLPGVGEYTAAAVSAFAFRQRALVLDTNIRRVLSRLFLGQQYPPSTLTQKERARSLHVLPDDAEVSATWNVSVMELGAMICTASAPHCHQCPVSSQCAWRLAGYPAYDGHRRRGQTYDGTDRQCRGRILSALRDSDGPVPLPILDATWPDASQRERALGSLLEDGLVVRAGTDTFALP